MIKKALITGITGQDGSYLAEYLLNKNYEVYGLIRPSSTNTKERINNLLNHKNFKLVYGDLLDQSSLINIFTKNNFDEVYNLAAQSHVGKSFEIPQYTTNVNAVGVLNLLESIKILNLNKIRFYQASTSELFGASKDLIQNEKTPFHPCSPYGVAKLYAYWITINYRESYNLYVCNGILFNHESIKRGEEFVTRKITKTIASILYGLNDCLYLGNLNVLRDWGHAKDYVRAMWLMLQQENPDDYVISTGTQYSIRDFVVCICKIIGIELEFQGEGLDEVGIVKNICYKNIPNIVKKGDIIVRIDKNFFRPCEVINLLGDSSKAKNKLNWIPEISFEDMCKEMILFDLNNIKISI